MIREWLFGTEEEERPPKPEPKEGKSRVAFYEAIAYWPGSNGGQKVQWKESNEVYSMVGRETLYRDATIQVEKTPYLEGTVIEANPEQVTYEDEKVVAVYEGTYIERPTRWSEAYSEWRFSTDYDTLTWERVK